MLYVVIAVAILAVLIVLSFMHSNHATSLSYNTFLSDLSGKQVKNASVNNATGVTTPDVEHGTTTRSTGPARSSTPRSRPQPAR